MSILNGIGGAVNGKTDIRQWQISSSSDLQKYVASNTKGGSGRLAGNGDWQGNYNAYGHSPSTLPGESLAFQGSIDGTNGAVGTAICDSVEITIDIEAGAIISHVVNFSSNGALSLGAAAASDATVPDPPTAIGCKVELGTLVAAPVWTEITDVRTVTLTITAENTPYVSSSTAGGTRRLAGNVDWTCSISVYEDDFSDLPAVDDEKAIRIYVTGALYWLLEWGIFGEVSDLLVDRESAANVGATLNLSMKGYADVDAAATEGSITEPDSTVFWPAA